jgi:glycine/D-amino acid oxidase-like deaminating enzyme
LRRIEPRLCEDAIGGLWTKGNARVDPGPYTRAVLGAAVSRGAKVVKAEARGLRHQAGRVTGVAVDSGTLDCDGVVIAQGAWSEQASGWLGVPLPVQAIKGELLLAETRSGAPEADISWRNVGLYAAGGNRVVLGGTEDNTGLDAATTVSARTRILAGIHRLLPGIGTLRVTGQSAGLRPVTPDGFPIVGIPAPWENVCVAAGAGRKGMLLGAGLGMAAAEIVTRGETGVPVTACAPGRQGLE